MTAEWIEAWGSRPPEVLPTVAVRPPRTTVDDPTPTDLGLPRHMGESDPRVSVIIPTYRDAAYLPDALRTVAAQSMDDLEVIIVDSDGVDWVEGIADARSWVRYVTAAPDGVGAARNDGIEAARGTFVAFLDADDYWHPTKLERQLAAMGSTRPAAFTGYHFVNYWAEGAPAVSQQDVSQFSGDPAVAALRRRIDAHVSTLCCRADVVPDRPFAEDLTNFEDVAFAVDRFRDATPVHVTDPLAVRRLRPGSLADRTDPVEKARHRIAAIERLIDAHPSCADAGRRTIAEERYRIGNAALDRGRSADARTSFGRAMRAHPSPSKVAFAYLLSYLPGTPRDRIVGFASSLRLT